jgi:uncharacterized integral membrane protein
MTMPRGNEQPPAPGQPGPGAQPGPPVAESGAPAGQQAPAQPAAAEPAPAAQAQPTAPAQRKPPAQHVVRRTRVGGVWVASALFALVLLILLIFILENGQKVSISFLGANGHLPLGVALLFAAVIGVLLVVLPGTARILQLRHTARRHRKQDAKAGPAQPPAAQQP